jgi:Helix-turn-helix domain
VNENKSRSQRAQTRSRAAREPASISLSERLALSPREFAAAVGRSPTYAYRQIYAGRIKPISDAGRLLIPRSEVDRFLARAAEYNPQTKPELQNEIEGGQS